MAEFDEEQAQERRQLVKGIHPKMKIFWNSDAGRPLRESGKYGSDFPSFWQELETWEHLKTIQKIFLIVCEKRESGQDVQETDIQEIEATVISKGPCVSEVATETSTATIGDGDKKRRKRWEVEEARGSSDTVAPEFASLPPPPASSSAGETLPGMASAENDTQADDGAPKKARRNRWGGDGLAGIAGLGAGNNNPLSQEAIQQTMVLKLQLQQLNDRMLNVAQESALAEQDPNRSPSPPPKYDSNGKRTNTREVRLRESLTKDRGRLIDELVKLNPLFQPPADAMRSKPTRKVFIPFREFPNYNFIGLIIGPRGNTQKKMEQETNCKISIRGKGSVKEGSKGRSSQNEVTAEDEDLHVYITGDNDESLDAAEKLVQDLLRPIDDDKNDHKQKQLRELALINGTLREDEYCPVCGDKGHRQFECPHRAKNFKAAGVKCSICGDLSHPTRDCPLKTDMATNEVALDSEYNSFIAELDGRSADEPQMPRVNILGAGTSNGLSSSTTDAPTVPKKTQKIIHVTTVMTGMLPPTMLTTNVTTTSMTNSASSQSIMPGAAWNPYGPLNGPAPGAGAFYGQSGPQMHAEYNMDYNAYSNYGGYGYSVQPAAHMTGYGPNPYAQPPYGAMPDAQWRPPVPDIPPPPPN